MEQSIPLEQTPESEHREPIRFSEKPLEERRSRLAKLMEKNPNKIPIVFEKHPQSKLPETKSVKFISTRNLKLSYFTSQLRAALKLAPECSLFLSSSKSKIVKQDMLIGELYDAAKDADGFLYLEYREVESFGGQ